MCWDTDTYHFDHVTVWNEPVGNYSCGPKYSGRRNVRMGRKEKFRSNVLLTISKCGKKLIPLIIFKDMTFFFTIDDILELKN